LKVGRIEDLVSARRRSRMPNAILKS